MKARGFFVFCSIIFLLSLNMDGLAQQASAELISSFLPAKLKSGEQVKDGIQNVFLKDNRLYIANIWAGLQVLDISDPAKPKEIAAFTTENRTHNVFVQDNYAYISNELSGVLVLDISQLPVIKKVAQIKTQGDAYWVVANYPYVYVAETSKGVNIYDISDLNHIRLMGSYATQGWAWALYLDKNYLYVAEKNGGVLILDVSFAGNPVRTGQFPEAKNVRALQVEDGVAYLANGPDGFWQLDVTNPSFPRLLSKLSIDGYIYDICKSGNTAFLANEIKHRVDIVDVSDILKPVKSGEYIALGKVYGVFKRDIYVYVAADIQSLILRYNRPPYITPISNQTIDENKLLQVLSDADDPDGDAIYFSIDNLPAGANFDSLKGELNWTPDYEQSGNYPKVKITVHENTASSLSASTNFEIAVTHINRSPAINDIPDQIIDEDKTLTFTIPAGNDPDKEDRGKLFYTADNLPVGASFDPASRVFSWTPTFEQSGIYTVDFAVNDGAGGVARDACVITVNHIDRKPSLVKIENQGIDENKDLVLNLKGADPDKEDQNALKYKAENLPEGARFNDQTATFTWTPTFDQSGLYKNLKFVFIAGKLSDTILVDISVNHVNRPPVMQAVVDQIVDENKPLKFSVVVSDPDREDAGKLVVTSENLPQGAYFNADSLAFRWTANFEQSGLYEKVSFTVKDPGGLSDSKTINIKVNHINRPPSLAEIEPKTVNENTVLTFNLAGSDPDREDDGKLVYKALKLPTGALLNGSVFEWTPSFDQSGIYEVTFQVTDPSGLSDQKKTTITVVHVNRSPVLAQIVSQSVDENKLLTFTVTASDPDTEDKGKLSIRAEVMPDGASFDSTTGKLSWTPTYEQSGQSKVKFIVSDPSGLNQEQTVDISVAHVNRSPVFTPLPSLVLQENSAWSYQVPAGQDPDKEDEGKLSYSAAGLPPGALFDDKTLMLTWTPSFDQSGEYTVTISVTDGPFKVSQPLVLQVQHVNRAPQITQPVDASVNENVAWRYEIEFSDPDKEDTGKLTLDTVNLPEGALFDKAASEITWTPTYDQAGTYQNIKLKALDPAGLMDEKNFTINVNNVNRPPVLAAISPQTGIENTPASLQLTASDPDKEDQGKLKFSGINLPEGATLDPATGGFNWLPGFKQAGTYQITFKVSDSGELSAEQAGSLTISDFNRLPVLSEIPPQSVKENEALTFNVSAKDEDSDNTLKYSMKNAPQGATLDPTSGAFNWSPTFEQAGKYNVTFIVSDGIAEASANVEITVENVNRPPQFEGLSDIPGEENSLLSFTVKSSDADGNPVTLSAESLPDGADFNTGTGLFKWTPTYEQSGEHAVNFTVTDGENPVSRTVKINIKNVNRKPEITGPSNAETQAGSTLNLEYQATDPDNDAITFSGNGLPSGAQIDSRTGKFSWTPADDQSGSFSLELSASDNQSAVSTKTTVIVTPKPQTAPADTTGN